MSQKEFDKDRREFDRLANEFVKGKLSRRDFLKGAGSLTFALAFSGERKLIPLSEDQEIFSHFTRHSF